MFKDFEYGKNAELQFNKSSLQKRIENVLLKNDEAQGSVSCFKRWYKF